MGARQRNWCGLGAILALGLILGAVSGSRAENVPNAENRHFQIFVDDKPAGNYYMAIAKRADGAMVVNARADVRLRYLLISYHYSYRGTEIWKDGKLISLDSSSDDNGKRFHVEAQAQADGLHVTANGQESQCLKDVWTTSCWRLPDAKCREGAIAILDVDTGRQLNGTMSRVGTAKVDVGGQVEECSHYRVTGGVQLELWYDAQERLVRQESVDDGHRTRLELRSR